jgi:hypothetical protein
MASSSDEPRIFVVLTDAIAGTKLEDFSELKKSNTL